MGFEHERASRMIVETDPELLYLGKGISENEHLTHASHLAPMEYFHKLVNDMVASRGNVKNFEFSCRDKTESKDTILKIAKEVQDEYNIIVVPLNTKISTVGIAEAALINSNIQICYAEPEIYNYKSYSLPDNYVTKFNIL